MPSRPLPAARRARCLAAALLAVACAREPKESAADSARAAAASAPAEPVEDLTRVDTNLAPALKVDLSKMTRQPSGLYVLDRKRGTGAAPDSQWVDVHYTGWLADGTEIDDTRKTGKPHRVLIGYGKVIPAWDSAISGMRAGGRRLIVVPPELGYGKAGQPGRVPSRATLVFDLELVKVHPK
jgi:FKBP-type peptidyl-prolyl cis-trans isomerase